MWRYKNGHLNNESFFVNGWDLVIECLNKLKQDISIDEFLKRHFPGDDYSELRDSVCNFVSGYDTGDPLKASSFALRKEWESEDIDATYRIKGGYGAMIKYLGDECEKSGGLICLNSVVKEIHWQSGNVKVVTIKGSFYEARQVLIALPLGVLQTANAENGAVVFHPPVTEQNKAIQAMGFGAVIKILLEFDSLFWEDKFAEELAGKSLKNMGYLFSDEEIPTWWTQAPQHSPVLTGWIGGPAAANKTHTPDEEILKQSLQSLGKIFNRKPDELKDKLLVFKIVNWTAEPFTCGSYAYDTIASPVSRKVLNTPVSDTLFFAGDYLYEGPIMGTVEAALTSGKEMAEKMIKA
jgi:monoamine oxidase